MSLNIYTITIIFKRFVIVKKISFHLIYWTYVLDHCKLHYKQISFSYLIFDIIALLPGDYKEY